MCLRSGTKQVFHLKLRKEVVTSSYPNGTTSKGSSNSRSPRPFILERHRKNVVIVDTANKDYLVIGKDKTEGEILNNCRVTKYSEIFNFFFFLQCDF